MKRIVDTIIFYDNETEVYTYAKHLSQQTAKDDVALVIVVNKNEHTNLEDFKNRLDMLPLDIYLFNPEENLGYLNGTIFGYHQYCQISESVPEWVVVSNTDIEFRENTFFEQFTNTSYEDDVWCVAPSVYSPKKNSYDNPEYIDRCTKEKINQLIYIHERPQLAYLYTKFAKCKGLFKRNEKQHSQYIYSAKGCFFIISNELATIIFNKKYKALMYSEESYISELVRKYDKKIYYDSEIEVIHNENSVTGKLEIKTRAKYLADSLKIIRDEFYMDE